jgi:hypothetical protein
MSHGPQQLSVGHLGALKDCLVRAFTGAAELHARALVDPVPNITTRRMVEELLRDLGRAGGFAANIYRDMPSATERQAERDGFGCPTPHPLLSVKNKPAKPSLTIVGKEVDEKTARSCVAVFAGGIDDMGLEGPSPKGAA